MHKYEITITSEQDIPAAVIVEHIAHSMRALRPGRGGTSLTSKTEYEDSDVTFTSANPSATYPSTSVRNHPFDGPEMFDDVQPPPSEFKTGGYVSGTGPIASEVNKGDYIIPKATAEKMFPKLGEALRKLREERGND